MEIRNLRMEHYTFCLGKMFGRFIKLYNINVKVLNKQTNLGFAAEAGFFWGGKGGVSPQKKGVTFHPQVTDFREKKSSASSIRIVSCCKYDVYFNKYDMYSIVGIDKKHMEKELV